MSSTTTTTRTMFLSNAPPPPVKRLVPYSQQPTTTDPTVSRATQGGIGLQQQPIPSPRVFGDKFEEREYLKGRLVLAFRLFAKHNLDEGLTGHITLRDPILRDHFWANPLGRPFQLMRRSDLILVNGAGEVVGGGTNRLLDRAAYAMHHTVHAARPEVNCVAHSHSLYGRTFSSLGRPLQMLTQEACAFHNDVAVYRPSSTAAVPANEKGEEQHHIAKALGDKKAALLQNQGLLTCGETVEAAAYWFYALERCCQSELMALAVPGAPALIEDKDAASTYKSRGTAEMGWLHAQPMFEVMAHESGDDYLQ
ncbi:hypothetical protein ACRALDRAFT_1066013 [Sodiomyces alcalophilus JCM 7366]|uniref:uncharacterized protein n=1 Tax=Sodiomyces alcalophilus JCM 7366 TaxID=591952 RepID=UPI0039B69A20